MTAEARVESARAEGPYFAPELFDFLRELRQNNNRDWFQANRERYESQVREPMLRFIADFGPRLERISPHFAADPRPVGGSMFRIHRDIRFSKDKSPYKTAASAHFRHETGRHVHVPGFYLHLEPDSVFAGAGLWHPDADTLAQVRQAIVTHPDRWRAATSGKAFRALCHLEGDVLKRPPSGYDPGHPLIEDLKRKDFVSVTTFSQQEACMPTFIERFTEACQASAPFVRFLTTALGQPW